jgi:RNA polymerase sigma-70 factor (ECF subfamily)
MELAKDPESQEEFELLRQAGAGSEPAVRWLFRTHVARVHRTCARILGPHDPDLEDVVQQVFLAALKGAGGFDQRSKVSTWLTGIATRRALDQARSRHRRTRWQTVTESVGVGHPAGRPDTAHDALAEARAALATLTPDQRAVFVLHAVEGYTFKEIKEMTGVGISTLHARLEAARKRLDDVVGQSEGAGGDDGAAA